MPQVHVDWHALHSAFQMSRPELKCFFSLDEGTVLKLLPGDQVLATVRAEPEKYAAIEAVPSRIQYEWLDNFIKTLGDEELRQRMTAAVNGKGAFRRFKDILLTHPDERRRWFEFRDLAVRRHIVDWVREQGVDAQNAPDWEERPAAPGAPAPANAPEDIEALRDFVIAWCEGKAPATLTSPVGLEEMAHAIAGAFKVRPHGK